jgi:hypothetical protein
MLACPVVGPLRVYPKDTTGASNENSALVNVLTTDETEIERPILWFSIGPVRHVKVVADVHEPVLHWVFPIIKVGVGIAARKLRPLIVTVCDPDCTRF